MSSIQNIICCNILHPFARALQKISFSTDFYINPTETSSSRSQNCDNNNTHSSHLELMVSILSTEMVPILGLTAELSISNITSTLPFQSIPSLLRWSPWNLIAQVFGICSAPLFVSIAAHGNGTMPSTWWKQTKTASHPTSGSPISSFALCF